MTINFDNVYIKEAATVAGKKEKEGNLGNLYDKVYDDYYIGEKTFEKAEIKMICDAVDKVLKKANMKIDDINVIIGSDLLNQNTVSSYSMIKYNKPYLGVYNACASMCEEIIIASNILQNNHVKNILITSSSHNLTAERQYRNPVEYGAPKPKRSTYTVTGCGSLILTNDKNDIKVSSVTIGIPTDKGVTDTYDMGSVMAPSAARVIYNHLKNTNTKPEDYDLILTGDLGVYGKEILKLYLKKEYNINIKDNYEDSACIIYNREKQKEVNAGGSGVGCLPLVTYSKILKEMKEKKLKKVLLVATGALMNTTMNNQKFSIPSISHAVCLEVV